MRKECEVKKMMYSEKSNLKFLSGRIYYYDVINTDDYYCYYLFDNMQTDEPITVLSKGFFESVFEYLKFVRKQKLKKLNGRR